MQCQRRDHIPREDCPGDIRMSPVIPNHANRKKYPPLLFFILLFVFSLVLYWGRAILCVVVFQLTTWKKNISSWSHLLKVLSWVKKISADFFRCLSPQKRLMSRTSTSRNCRLTAAIRELLSISILREGKQGWKLVLTRMVFYWIFKKNLLFCRISVVWLYAGVSRVPPRVLAQTAITLARLSVIIIYWHPQ